MRIISIISTFLIALTFHLLSESAFAKTVTEPENASCGNDAARTAIARLESKAVGGYDIVNKWGYLGRYQIGEEKLVDLGLAHKDSNTKDNKFSWTSKAKSQYGISSNADFLANGQAQEAIYTDIQNLSEKYLGSAMNSVGQTMGGCGSSITRESLLAGSQLGEQKVRNYIQNGMKCTPGKKTATNDANGVCVEKFMCAVAGCNHIEKDMSKDTCGPTMKIIEELDCSNMPSDMRGFCNTNKPFLMTRAECSAAESNSKATTMGPQKEQCENLSFGPGSGSWSFVLACSYAGDFVADQDGESNPSGPVSDPACIEKLKGMGLEVRAHGDIHRGTTGGTPCIIKNAVSIQGKAVPFGKWATMTCDLAVAMEEWGRKIAPLGVTGYSQVQTLSCRPMVDKRGERKGTVSEHGLGRAADIPSVIVGGRTVSMGAIHQPMTPDGMLVTQIKAAACSTFRGVLSPTYAQYAGKYAHFHVEWGRFQGCR